MSCFASPGRITVDDVKTLSADARNELKNEINAAHPHHIFQSAGESSEPDKCKIICPFCGNGTGEDSTPVEVTRKNGVWLYHCFKCDSFSGDLLKIIAEDEKLTLSSFDDMCKALAIGANLINYNLTGAPKRKKTVTPIRNDADSGSRKERELIVADIEAAKKNLVWFSIYDSSSSFDAHYNRDDWEKEHARVEEVLLNPKESDRFKIRGLTYATVKHFGCGFIRKWTPPKCRVAGKQVPPTPRFIIPAGIHYNAVVPKYERQNIKPHLYKMHAGKLELFNAADMLRKKIVFVVEGEIDAMSIWQAFNGQMAFAVVAVLGAGNWSKTLIPRLNQCQDQKFIILFDGDEAGRTNSEKLRRELLKRNIPAVSKFLRPYFREDLYQDHCGDKLDANDILQYRSPNSKSKKSSPGQKILNEKISEIYQSALYDFELLKLELLTPGTTMEEAAQKIASKSLFRPQPEDMFNIHDQYRNKCKVLEEQQRAEKEKMQTVSTSAPTAGTEHPLESELEKLNHLKSLPASPERDSQIIAQIREMCEWKVTRKGTRINILPTLANVKLIFEHDPNLSNLVGFDEFQCSDVLMKDTPWKRANNHINREWTDRDDAQLRLYLRENYGELQGKQLIEDMVISRSQANAFNAVKRYFNGLPKWDGTPRAETLFTKFLRVTDTPYAREVTLNWLLGAVARIFHPGCRYQTALVLHGNQKIGKSYILERIAGAWYLELTENVEDSHAADAIQKGWITEIKEMSAMRKSEINSVKAFIERSSETRREAYARRATTTYRHCVFAITVNDSEFLRDVTGNRRYLILHCNSAMFDYVEGLTDDFIRQLWAEVYQKYNELFDNDKAFDEKKLALSRRVEQQAEAVATHYLQDDGMTSEIKGFLDKKIPPQFIWQELTREERRDFYVKGYVRLLDAAEDLVRRRITRGGRHALDDVKQIKEWLDSVRGTEFVRRKTITQGATRGSVEYFIYGSEYRQHICATEIFNECFGADKRKHMPRINEILSSLDGWNLGARLTRADAVYPDQKKPYYRNPNNYPPENIKSEADLYYSTLF